MATANGEQGARGTKGPGVSTETVKAEKAAADAVLARAAGFSDARDMIDQQRADRAAILTKVMAVFADAVGGTQEHPVEGLYLSEENIITAFRGKMIEHGLAILPNVVETIPADPSGNVCVVVEFAIADTDGAYWPAAVRVCGWGNDRIGGQRPMVGDKAASRAMSAAWKEAISRIAFLGRGFDPEGHMMDTSGPAAGSRPSNRDLRPAAMTMKEEDEARDKLLRLIDEAQDMDALDRLMGAEKVKGVLGRVGSGTRKKIDDAVKEMRHRLDYGRGRERRPAPRDERRDERRQDDERQYGDRDRGGSYDEASDDDIPI